MACQSGVGFRQPVPEVCPGRLRAQVPTSVREGWLGPYWDDFSFFVESPTLGQIPGSSLLETVGVGWVGQDDFELVVCSFTLEQVLGSGVPGAVGLGWVGQDELEVVINSPTLGQLLSSNPLKTVGVGWVGQDKFEVGVVSLGMRRILGSTVLRTVSVGRLDIKEVVRVLRGQFNTVPGFGEVKRGASSCARSKVVVLSEFSPVQPLLPSWVVTLWEIGVEGVAGG